MPRSLFCFAASFAATALLILASAPAVPVA